MYKMNKKGTLWLFGNVLLAIKMTGLKNSCGEVHYLAEE